MLLAHALVQLLRRWDHEELADLSMDLVRDRIPIVLVQILARTIQSQDAYGSWGQGSCEVTAYGVLNLTTLSSIPWATSVLAEVLSAIELGRRFLTENHQSWIEPSYL